jgi:hypothetical protein
VGKWHTRSIKEKRFVTIGQVLGSEDVSVPVEALESQLELGDVDKAPCGLPREPAAFHENLLPPTRTVALYAHLLCTAASKIFVTCSKKYPGYSAVGCFTIPNSLATFSPYFRLQV